MRAILTILWFMTAVVAGAAIFAVSRPIPVIRALVTQLKGRGILDRCHQDGACGKPAVPDSRPIPSLPSDLDRA